MSERRTRSGGAAQRSGPKTPCTKSMRRSQRKSGSDLPNIFPEIWPKTPHVAPVRKPIVLKKIVAHAVEIPPARSLRRSSRISFILEKENNPPLKEPTKEDLFKTCSIPCTPTTTPVLYTMSVESNSEERELDARDLEMSKKVRRSYSRLEILGSASTSTPGRRSFFGFEGPEDLPGVSPVVCSKLTEIPKVPVKPWAPDTTLPGISPPVVKEKRRKKKAPEILSPTGSRSACSKQVLKTAMQPTEPQPEESEVSEDSNVDMTPSSSEQKVDLQSEPTVTFLFTLLNTPESKDTELDSDTQERRFFDPEDWSPKKTSEEMQHLQKDCRRLQEALDINQRENMTLRQKLKNLPTSLYQGLEEILTLPEEVKISQEEASFIQKITQVAQEDTKDTQEEAELALVLGQQKKASSQPSSREPSPVPVLEAALPGSSQEPQSAQAGPEARTQIPSPEATPPASPSLSPSNKNPH